MPVCFARQTCTVFTLLGSHRAAKCAGKTTGPHLALLLLSAIDHVYLTATLACHRVGAKLHRVQLLAHAY